jgi:hypothetical protein
VPELGGVAPPHDAGGVGALAGDEDAWAAQKKTGGLSLDRAIRLLKSALPQPLRTIEEALRLVEYHQQRNKAAKKSHTKTWMEQNPEVKIEPLVATYSPSDTP